MTKQELRDLCAGSAVPVQKIPTGATALNLTPYEWSQQIRGYSPAGDDHRQALKSERTERVQIVVDHAGREFYRNEEGEWL